MGYSTSSIGQWTAYVPTYTGFTGGSEPTVTAARYCLVGKMCTVRIGASAGTSNATTFTVTLPFTSHATAGQIASVSCGTDNGSQLTTANKVSVAANSNIATLFKDAASGAWTSSGNKNAVFVFTYEIA